MSANRFRFTKKSIQELKPSAARRYYYDQIVGALAVLVTPAGARSFYLVKKHRGVYHRVRISAVDDLPIEKARGIASEMLANIMAGKPLVEERSSPEKLTLQQVFDEYMTYTNSHRKPATVYNYSLLWDTHLSKWAKGKTLDSVRRREVSALHIRIGDEIGHHITNRVVALVRAMVNRAIREYELDIPNPAAGISFYKENPRSRRLEPAELPKFFKAVHEEPNATLRDFVLLALFTGVRKSNLLKMKWKHINLDGGIWVVPAEESKTNEDLPVVLSSFAIEILKARERNSISPFVFPGMNGIGHYKDPKRGWRRILKRAELENLRMHDLRRSLASFQIDTGTPLEVIQKTLGHGSKSTTEIYARLAMDPVRESVQKATEAMLKCSM